MSGPQSEPDAVVQELGEAHVPAVRRVLCDSFHDYPVMRYVLGSSGNYEHRFDELIGLFVMARIFRGEPMLGIAIGGELEGVALVSYPDGPPGPTELDEFRDAVWQRLGSDARQRYEAFGAACQRSSVDVPNIHLNMLGVRRTHQRRGLSRPLLDAVHRRARATPGVQGVTLTTEKPANLALYAHFGYRVVGHASVAPELETWSLFRENGDTGR